MLTTDEATDPNARVIRPGLIGTVPHTADDMTSYFKGSGLGELNRTSIDSYHKLYVNNPGLKIAYEASVTSEHARHAPNSQSYTLSIPMQVRAVMRRRWQILKGDRVTQVAQLMCVFSLYVLRSFVRDLYIANDYRTVIAQATFTGTVFLRTPETTAAYFSRGVVLFLYESLIVVCASVLNLAFNSALFCCGIGTMSEIPALFSQRLIVRRHQKAALYYPFIDSLAHTIVDIPITLISVTIVSVIIYFLAGLQKSAKQFLYVISSLCDLDSRSLLARIICSPSL